MTSNIIKSFSDKAYSYDSQSFVQKDVNKRLLSRLDIIMHTKKAQKIIFYIHMMICIFYPIGIQNSLRKLIR